MRRTLLSTLMVMLLLGGWGVGKAQTANAAELKPLVTVSFSGYEELRDDIDFLGKISDAPGMGQQLEGMLKLMTQGKGLAGLDTKRPWGAVVQTDGGQEFPIYGFIPVTDLKALMAVVREMQMAPLPEEEPADGIYEIELGGPAVCIQQKGNWAFIADSRDSLAQVPADPSDLLGDLNETYDLAVRAQIQNVPTVYRTMFIEQLEMGMMLGMAQLPEESEADYLMRANTANQAIEMLKDASNDLDTILVGWAVDSATGTSYIDIQVTAVPGSKMAAQMALVSTGTSRYAGFELPDAAVTINSFSKMTDSDVATAKSSIKDIRTAAIKELDNQGLSDEEKQLAEQLLTDLIDVLEKTIEGKSLDAGMSLILKPDALTLVMGTTIALGDKLEVTLKQIVGEAIKADANAANYLKLDTGNLGNVRLHTLSIPTAEMNDETAEKLFGDRLDVIVGITNTSVYLAAGRDALPTLEKAIEASKAQADKEIPPARMVVAGAPIAKFVAEMAPDDESKQIAGMIASILEQSAGKDHLTMTSTAVPNGWNTRIELEEGLLKVIGTAAQMSGVSMPMGGVLAE